MSRARRRRAGRRPASLRYAREFAAAGASPAAGREMNRLYVVEPTPSVTGSIADHRLPLQAGLVGQFALRAGRGARRPGRRDALLPARSRVLDRAARRATSSATGAPASSSPATASRPRCTRSSTQSTRRSATSDGPWCTPSRSRRTRPTSSASLRQLAADMDAGKVDTLIVLDANPSTRRRRIRVRRAADEQGAAPRVTSASTTTRPRPSATGTSRQRTTWSRGATRGPATAPSRLIQPLIAPLYNGRTAHEWSARCSSAGRAVEPRHRARLLAAAERLQGAEFERFWRRALHDGMVPNTAAAEKAVTARPVDPAPSRERRQGPRDRVPRRPDGVRRPLSRTTAGCRSCRSRRRS